MNKMQVRSAQDTLREIKDELIEEKKKFAEELAYIEAQIEAVITLMPVLILKEDLAPVFKTPFVSAHFDTLPEEVLQAVSKKFEAVPPEAVNTEPARGKYSKCLTEQERNENKRIAKHNWYLANKPALDARRKQKQQANKQMAPEKFGRQFESAAQVGKPNYFGDGE